MLYFYVFCFLIANYIITIIIYVYELVLGILVD